MKRQPRVIAAPDLSEATDYPLFEHEQVVSGGSYSEMAFRKCDLSGGRAADLRFQEVIFQYVTLQKTEWRGQTLLDARFTSCDLSNANWLQARCQRLVIENSRLTGANLSDARMENVQFIDCQLDLSVFQEAKLEACLFRNCNLEQADFERADLRQAVFENCNLRQVRFREADLKGADLRGSELGSLDASVHDIRGAIVSPAQMIQFAALIGVTVE